MVEELDQHQGAVATVVGHVVVGEANIACSEVLRRQQPSQIMPLLAMVVTVFAVMFVASEIALQLSNGDRTIAFAAAVAGGFLGCWVGTKLYQRIWLKSYKARFEVLNGALEFPVKVVVHDDWLSVETGAVHIRIGWDAIGELFEAKGYWFLHVQGAMHAIPRRCFASSEDEHHFIAAIVSRMSDAAVGRSEAARQFAA